MLKRLSHSHIRPLNGHAVVKRPVYFVVHRGLVESGWIQFDTQGCDILGFVHQIVNPWSKRQKSVRGDVEVVHQVPVKGENESGLDLLGGLGLAAQELVHGGVRHVHVVLVVHSGCVVLIHLHGVVRVVHGVLVLIGPFAMGCGHEQQDSN